MLENKRRGAACRTSLLCYEERQPPGGGLMSSEQDTRNRVLGVWGRDSYAWSGEERQRAGGFPIDPSGRQRVLGFPAGLPAGSFGFVKRGWHPVLAHPVRSFPRRHLRRSVQEQNKPTPEA